jgi:hypothetical protein
VPGFRAGEAKLVSRAARFVVRLCGWFGPLRIGMVLLRRCGDERDGLLPTRYVLGTSRMSSGPRVLWLGIASGWCPVRCFRIVKDASSRGRTGRTLFRHCDSRSPQARPRGARVLRTGVIRHFDITLRLATPDIRLTSADAFAVVGGGCTVNHMGARPNRAVVVKTALTCVSYSHSSAVLGSRPERERIYLVTICALLVPGEK